ncbi:MAG: hypothetical protein HYR72_01905 [Deltaproteobacteria bacterium]|nr:hypothetical protein [Deltaproteobacteria bacterium]MBI3390810.1 hypothetical protein [Deltaproteobacteria bacterium]
MTRRRIGQLAAAAAAVVLFGLPMAVKATIPNPNQIGPGFLTWLVQGYDECDPMTAPTTISNVAACPSSSGSTKTFRLARLIVGRSGRVVLVGSGFPSVQKVQLKLTVRSSKRAAPLGTFVDETLNCPTATCSSAGVCVQTTTLGACATAGQLPVVGTSMNIEVIAAELAVGVGAPGAGDVIARPGLIR